MFDFDPKTEPDIYKAAFDELHRTDRQAEYIKYPRCLPCALYYLSMRNIYSYKLMDKVLDIEFIKEIFGKDVSIDVECPDYKGKRLPLELRHKAAKWLTDFAPEHEQPKKITAADKLFLDTVDTIKEIVKDEKLISSKHSSQFSDIILCKDKETGKFIQPRGFENYILGDVMFPLNDGSLQWLAVVILGWNNTFRESSLPLGNIIMKERQLKKIGYTPVFVIWYEFMSLSREDQIAYVSKKIN
ncbi:hypothetical protein NQ317_018213 [Molorchus minor]|uniref:RAP domain-containing protein n=1 Tax=Molorchus minor TaxID=1323400 RepID=A0ABQ9K4V0_9CUCU|nr:hypothetical protein NQ317_018213 [Molorchus minor]